MRKETIDSSFWSEMLPSLKRKAVNEALGSVFYGNMTLNKWLIRELQRDDGNGIFADTVFEPLFPWADEGVPFGALEIKKGKGLFHTETMDALEANRGSACPRNRKLFTHQMQACRILLDKTKVNSIIVASGTGSGKTECFMLPMLEDLVAGKNGMVSER